MIPPSRTFETSPTSGQVIDMAAPSWCWSWLGAQGEGILSYETSRGRRSLTVPFAVSHRQITIPLAPFDQTGWGAVGTDASLEVSGRTFEDLRWVVRATGRAERDEPAEPSELSGLDLARRMHPANRVIAGSAEPSEQLFLREPRMRGFYETALAV